MSSLKEKFLKIESLVNKNTDFMAEELREEIVDWRKTKPKEHRWVQETLRTICHQNFKVKSFKISTEDLLYSDCERLKVQTPVIVEFLRSVDLFVNAIILRTDIKVSSTPQFIELEVTKSIPSPKVALKRAIVDQSLRKCLLENINLQRDVDFIEDLEFDESGTSVVFGVRLKVARDRSLTPREIARLKTNQINKMKQERQSSSHYERVL